MTGSEKKTKIGALIVSTNPLFRMSLHSLLVKKYPSSIEIMVVTTIQEAVEKLRHWKASFIILDYDDQKSNRNDLLHFFISGESPLQIMLVSLNSSGSIVVYERQSIPQDQVDDWLDLNWKPNSTQTPPAMEE